MSTSRDPGMRVLALAFLVAVIAALVVDALIQLSTSAVRVSSYGSGAPWWIRAHVIERGRWVVFALLLWLMSPRSRGDEGDQATPLLTVAPATAWTLVARATAAVPILWILATWIVTALRFTVLGSWSTDGRVFASSDYYSGLLLDLTPWLLAAAAVAAVSRHLESSR